MSIIDDVNEIAGLVDKSKNLELYTKILHLEVSIYELNKEKRSLEEKNEKLQKLLDFKKNLTFKDPVYYTEGDTTPYCPKCWESDKLPIHLTVDKESERGFCHCQNCKSQYLTKPEPPIRYDRQRDYDEENWYE